MTIVIVEDQKEIRYSLSKILNRKGYKTIEFSGSEDNIVEDIKRHKPTLAIVDIMLGKKITGIELSKKMQSAKLDLPVVLITAYTTPSNIIEASRIGVKDILEKPFEPDKLLLAVSKYANKNKEFTADIVFYEEDGEKFIGSFETMKNVYKKIGIASTNALPVLIKGETGSGKELIVKMIHRSSDRKDKQLVALNCAAIPSDLFESQLFGHEKGSFTGADRDNIGLIEQADSGTLFLDEIGELSIPLQSKLLRFLETKTYRRIGASKEMISNARILAATNIDLSENVREGRFRKDLYYRIAMIMIDIPPLRERVKDIPELAKHFIFKANKELGTSVKNISKEALKILLAHYWSGNIREFRNSIYNGALNANNDMIDAADLKLESFIYAAKRNSSTPITDLIDDTIEKYGLDKASEGWEKIEKIFLQSFISRYPNYTQAAKALKISRNTLKSKLRKYDIYTD